MLKTHQSENHPGDHLHNGDGRPSPTADPEQAGKSISELHEDQSKNEEQQSKAKMLQHALSTTLKLRDHPILKAGHDLLHEPSVEPGGIKREGPYSVFTPSKRRSSAQEEMRGAAH